MHEKCIESYKNQFLLTMQDSTKPGHKNILTQSVPHRPRRHIQPKSSGENIGKCWNTSKIVWNVGNCRKLSEIVGNVGKCPKVSKTVGKCRMPHWGMKTDQKGFLTLWSNIWYVVDFQLLVGIHVRPSEQTPFSKILCLVFRYFHHFSAVVSSK